MAAKLAKLQRAGGDKTVALTPPIKLPPKPKATQMTVVLPASIAAATKPQSPLATSLAVPPAPRVSTAPLHRPIAPAFMVPKPAPVLLSALPHQRQHQAFDVEVIESVTTKTRYRDAVKLGDNHALLVMTDFAGTPTHATQLVAHVQENVRSLAARGATPDAIFRMMNREMVDVGYEATATCVRLSVSERIIEVACAGTSAPIVLRGANESFVRPRGVASVALGRVRSAQFEQQALHFGQGDMLLVPSNSWTLLLERLLSQPPHLALQTIRFALRERRAQPTGGALLRLSLR